MDECIPGWGFPTGSRRAHYFEANGMALCRRYGFYFAATTPDDGKRGPDDCAACRKRLDRRVALAAGGGTGAECVNGCRKPVCPPSRVLCADCFAELDGKMQALAAGKETD